MKTAILLSGQLRSFARCLASQRHHLYGKFEDCEFFASVSADCPADDQETLDRLAALYPGRVRFEFVKQPTDEELGIAGAGASEFAPAYERARAHAPYPTIPTTGNVLRMFWALQRAWAFFQSVAKVEDFAAFVRVRPDAFFRSFPLDHDMKIVPCVFTPWWGAWGGVNDRFALVVGPKCADAYFGAFDAIPGLVSAGCPFHPESLLHAALQAARVPVHAVLGAEFTALRGAGDRRPDDDPIYLPGDLYRYQQARQGMPRNLPAFATPQRPEGPGIVTRAPPGAFGPKRR